MKTLFILNDQPYGNERSYNAMRLINTLAKRDGEEVKAFFLGDAPACAKSGQKVPPGYYNMESSIKVAARKNVEIGLCGTCMDARGIQESEIAEGTHRSNLEQLADWTQWADKVIVF